jgi:hypothetical protein
MTQGKSLFCTLALSLIVASIQPLGMSVAHASEYEEKKAISTGKAAGIGALLGLALGRDPIVGAAAGAAMGAAGGMIANEVTKDGREKQSQEIAERDQRIAELQEDLGNAERARAELQSSIVDTVGPDVWEGYKSLRGCQYKRASALANVGAVSDDTYHQLGAIWLKAMIAVEREDSAGAQQYFKTLATEDPEIDTVQQASLATDKAVLDMRGERRDLGIKPCA